MSSLSKDHQKLLDNELTMYIIVNNDLKMGKGKIAAQVGHLVGRITEELVTMKYENGDSVTMDLPEPYVRYFIWLMRYGAKKVVLKGTEVQIRELIKESECRSIIDAGRTQVAPDSLTVVGFLPSYDKVEKFKSYSLL